MNVKSWLTATGVVVALAIGSAPALASLGGEVAQGRAVAGQLQAGQATCSKLSDSDFEHLGEYVMDRMAGSRSAHETMNARMEAMMGSALADRMHESLGKRFAGCGGGTAGTMMGGGGMMGSGGWGSMMNARGWSSPASGHWHMMGTTHGLWNGAGIALTVLAALLGGLLVFLALRRPRREPSKSALSSS